MKLIKKIYRWCTKTRLRKLLSLILAILIFFTSIKFIFIPAPKVKASDIYLGLNEGYGGSINDNNTNVSGTITNAAWKTEDLCKFGKCLYFDGTGDYVSFGDDADLDFVAATNFTIEGWFRTPDITSGTRVLAAKYNSATSTDGGYKVYMDSSGYLIFGIDDDQTSFPEDSVSTTTTAFDDNKWHFFSAVKTGTSSITLYVDGHQYQTDSTISSTGTLANTDTFYIGIDGDGSSNGFSGFLDEIKIYTTTARSSTEIKSDYLGENISRGVAASFGPEQDKLSDGLVGYWKMDETSGNATDYSGNSISLTNNATITYPSGKFGNGSKFVAASSQYFSAGSGSSTSYYFDASDAAATDPNNNWLSDANAFDNDTDAASALATTGDFTTKYLKAEGTNAPASGDTISTVQARTYGGFTTYSVGSCALWSEIYTDGLAQSLGIIENPNSNVAPTWSSYSTLSTPTGGWDWTKLGALEIKHIPFDDGGGCSFTSARIAQTELLVTTSSAASIPGVSTVSFWAYPSNTTNYFASLTSTAYITASSGTLSATGFTNPHIYVNGVESSTITANTWQHITITSDAPITPDQFYIGRQGSNYFDGTLDDFRLYNRILSPFDITSLYKFAPGPVGYWKMDESNWTNNCSTDTVFDSSGNGFNGDSCPASTGPIGGATGKFGKAGTFDDNDDYVITTGNSKWDSMTNVTLSMWIKPSSHSAVKFIASKSVSTSDRWGFRWTDTGFLQLYDDIDNIGYTSCQVAVPTNSWSYITGTLSDNGDGTYANQLYVNGISQGCSHNSTGSWNSFAGSLYLGRDQSSGTTFNGIIDEVKIYDYVRSTGQIIEDMNGDHPAPGSPIGSSVAKWKMDEGYGTTAHDNSINGNDLTLSAASWTNSGKFGKAFNGLTNVRLSRTDDADLDFAAADDATFSVWFKSDSTTNPSTNEYLLEKGGNIATDAIGYAIYTSSASDGKICFGIDDDATSFPEDETCTSGDVYDNTWHHIVAKKTGTSRLDLYVDGKPDGTPDTSISATGTLENASTFYIGDTNGTDGTDEFLGDIDEVQIFRGALTDSQVQSLYNNASNASLGSLSTDSSSIASNSDSDSYCPPGQGSTCTPPVGYWKMDEGSWTNDCSTATVFDSSSNGYSGTSCPSSTGPASHSTGKVGSAGNFDGLDDYVDIGDAFYSDSITISAWINLEKLSTSQSNIVVKRNGSGVTAGNNEYELSINSTGKLVWQSWDSGGSGDIMTSTSTLSTNTWYHVAISYPGNGAGNANMYINGILDKQQSFAYAIGNFTSRIQIGARSGSNSARYFDGTIDDVRIYNYARTPAQVAWDYNYGGPVGWWKLDENTGTAANDSAGNSTAGTLTNTPTWATGKFNYGVTFAGSNQQILIADDSDFDFVDDESMSVTGWFKHSAASAQEIILSKYAAAGYKVIMESDGDITCGLDYDSTWTPTDSATSTLATYDDNSWHHFACVKDGATSLSLYIDGNLITTDSSLTASNSLDNADPLYLGIDADGTSNDYTGSLDDIRIYRYPLTVQQIRTVMNNGAALKYTQ